MPFAPEEAEEIKKQLLEQVENLPNENKNQIKKYIEGLDEKGLEAFLKQNKIQLSSSQKEPPSPECIFCSIVKNQIPSYKLAENKKSIAILEINPLSKGHTIIIPIEHATTEKIPKSAMSLAQKIAKKIKKKLKPEEIKIETSSFQGHAMINVIPIYKDIPLKKIKADEKELKLIQNKIEVKKRSKRKSKSEKQEKSKTGETKKIPELLFRVP